jgi:hypothetical protein
MSVAFAAVVAQVAFWTILVLGLVFGEIRRTGAIVFLVLWALGFFGLPRLSPLAGAFVTPYVAVLDIVLALVVFKGDVRLS